MNLFVIILSLFLFHGNYISGADPEGLNPVDVLATLKAKVPNYDLHNFVKTEEDYKQLNTDLTTYCTTSDASKPYALICNILAYELPRAYELPEASRPSKAIYKIETTSNDICSMKKVQLTNEWIWNILTNNGQKTIGVNAKDLCSTVTTDVKTLQLVRFSYKIAPRIRQDDLSKQNKDNAQSNTNDKSSNETAAGIANKIKNTVVDTAQAAKEKVLEVAATVANKTGEVIDSAKSKANELVETGKNKVDQVVDASKDKANQIADVVKQAGDQVVGDAQKKTDQVISSAKDTANQTAEVAKNKIDQTVEAGKIKTDQVIDIGKDKGAAIQSSLSNVTNKTGDPIPSGLDKVKPVGESLNNKTNEVPPVVQNATKEISTNTSEKSQPVLDLNKNTKPETEIKNDQSNKKDSENDDDDNAQQPKDNPQIPQIPKPDIPVQKDEQPVVNKTSENANPPPSDKSDTIKNPESGNDSLILTNLMKKYEISPAQLIQLIKNSRLNPSGNKIDLSLINSTSVDHLIKQKQNKEPANGAVDDDDAGGIDEEEDPISKIQQQETLNKKEPQLVDGDDENIQKDNSNIGNDPVEENETGNQPNNNEDADNQGDDKVVDGIVIKKPTEQDKFGKSPEKDIKAPEIEQPKSRPRTKSHDRYDDDDGWSGNFVTYFLLFTLFVVVGYLVLHNKNKLMAYVLEGRRSGASRTGSRPSHRGYEKLKNVNDVIPIDDAHPISDKEVVILKT